MQTFNATVLSILVVLFLGACASNGTYPDESRERERSSHPHEHDAAKQDPGNS